ncbi:unnamed protein product [Ceutorhynchus assimilis]|uniref:Uncharacterized protein n=1 Tax=Ceutorhynchus assimilis TaxID=467358 RepID=A0A9N9M979_9CUCU|nr:unnamed protein product [Ceutorhynchus assimilis]
MMRRLCLVLCVYVASDWSVGDKIITKRQTQDFKDFNRQFKRSPGHHGPPGGHGPPGHHRPPGHHGPPGHRGPPGRGPPQFEPTDYDNGYGPLGREGSSPHEGPPGHDWPPPGPPSGPPPEFVPPGHRGHHKHHHPHRPPHQGWVTPGPPTPNQPTWSSNPDEYTLEDKDKKVISGYIDENFPVILLDEENEIRK